MNNGKTTCEVCKKEMEGFYAVVIKGRGFVPGHKSCLRLLDEHGQTYLKKFSWGDAGKGSFSPGWLRDVQHRKVVKGGEVIRDYGRRYFV